MRITKKQLKQIVAEEVAHRLLEQIIEEEFDNTIKESYLDLKFGWTPTGGEVVEDPWWLK